jgi:hypothetical protein
MTLLQVYKAHILDILQTNAKILIFLGMHTSYQNKNVQKMKDILLTWAFKHILKKALKKVMMLSKCLCHEALGNNFRSERHFREVEQLTRLLLIAAQRRLILTPVEHGLQHLGIAAVLRAGARISREHLLIDLRALGLLPGLASPGLVEERRDEVARVVQVLAAVGATVGGDAHLVTLRIIPRTEKL